MTGFLFMHEQGEVSTMKAATSRRTPKEAKHAGAGDDERDIGGWH
jgi:hypothetical protein